MISHRVLALIIVFSWGISPLFCAEELFDTPTEQPVKVTADFLSYRENNRVLIASSNVTLTVGEVQITAPWLKLNVDEETAYGTGNIVITRGSDTLQATSFFYDFGKDEITLEKVFSVMHPPDIATGNIYLRADVLIDSPDKKIGTNGLFTTCDLPTPHYWVRADRFEYYPDKQVVGHNVTFYNPMWFIPFGLYSPIYTYELGNRNPILLTPKVGQNKETGWFIDNTLDYKWDDHHETLYFFDFKQKKGWGLGAQHFYTYPGQGKGNVLYYSLTEKTTIPNYVFNWGQSWQISETWRANHKVEWTDIYRLIGGRDHRTHYNFDLNYKYIGDQTIFSFDENRNFEQDRMDSRYEIKNLFNQQKNVSFLHQKALSKNSRIENTLLDTEIRLPEQVIVGNNVAYINALGPGQVTADERLSVRTSIGKRWDYLGQSSVVFDYTYDLDRDRYTGDSTYQYVEREPEASFQFDPFNWTLTQVATESISVSLQNRILVGRYHEAALTGSLLNPVRQKTADKYGAEQRVSLTLQPLPYNLQGNATLDYNQYAYNTQDQLFNIRQVYGLDGRWWGFLNPKLSYINGYANGSSPFFFDDKASAREERLQYEANLYYDSPDRFLWGNAFGWNYITQKRDNYRTRILIKPISTFLADIRSGYVFPENRVDAATQYLNIEGTITLRASTNVELFDTGFAWDPNRGELKQLSNTLRFRASDLDLDEQWTMEARFNYYPSTKIYKLDTVSVRKNLHERVLEISYAEATQEYRLKMTILAYPNDSISVSTDQNTGFAIQGGIFDQQEINRY